MLPIVVLMALLQLLLCSGANVSEEDPENLTGYALISARSSASLACAKAGDCLERICSCSTWCMIPLCVGSVSLIMLYFFYIMWAFMFPDKASGGLIH